MKKLKSAFIIFFIILILPAVFVRAAGSDVIFKTIEINAIINPDGSAEMQEIFLTDNSDSKSTEIFFKKELTRQEEISNLNVSLNGVAYQTLDTWDVNKSFSEKAYKCGIIKNENNYELCWGISELEKSASYKVNYHLTNLIKKCADSNFMDHIFIDSLNNDVNQVKITLSLKDGKFTEEDSKIWAGSSTNIIFDGNTQLIDGSIVISTKNYLPVNANFRVFASFSLEKFPETKVFSDKNFSDIKNKSLNQKPDASSNKKNIFQEIFRIIGHVIVFIGIIFAVLSNKKSKDSAKNCKIRENICLKEYINPDYYREIPFNNNLFINYFRLKSCNKLVNNFDLVHVFILKWIQEKRIKFLKDKIESKKFLSKKVKIKEKVCFELNIDGYDVMDRLEKELYEMFIDAQNKYKNKVLYSDDFKDWCKDNYKKLQNWIKSCEQSGYNDFLLIEGAKKIHRKILPDYTEITEIGIKLTSQMFGFKKYLEDFTIINERETREVELWDNYLIYAQLFGIAKKVAEQFKEIYPNYFNEDIKDNNFIFINDYYLLSSMLNVISHDISNTISQASSFQSGGFGSFGSSSNWSFSSSSSSFTSGGGGGGSR